jgi:hypothetical protein
LPESPTFVGVLDRVYLAVGGAEAEEDPETPRRIVTRVPQVLVEVVVNRPRVVLGLRRLHGHQQLGEESLEDAPEHRARILQAREAGLGQEERDVGRILIDPQAFLVAPVAAD